MKTRYLLYLSVIVFFLAGFISTSFGRSSQCTVMEKQGSLVTVTCPGEGTRIVNMGGSADIYKTGDIITINTTNQADKTRDLRPKTP
jgi:hypothetical protein